MKLTLILNKFGRAARGVGPGSVRYPYSRQPTGALHRARRGWRVEHGEWQHEMIMRPQYALSFAPDDPGLGNKQAFRGCQRRTRESPGSPRFVPMLAPPVRRVDLLPPMDCA